MRNIITAVVLAGIVALFFGAVTFAQMEMSGKNNMMMREMPADSLNTMMTRMSDNNRIMSGQFARMQEHMQSMLKMNDMKELHTEMEKHMEMMHSMQTMLSRQQKMYDTMMGQGEMGHMGLMEGTRDNKMGMSKTQSMEKKKKY